MRTRREIELRVSETLAKSGVRRPPIDIDSLARAEGLALIEEPFPGDVSGALIRSSRGSAIAVNSRHHLNRRRFSVAHELAHYLLDHTASGEDHVDWDFSIIRRDTKSSDASDTREIEANMFAANLLMPRDFLTEDIRLFIDAEGKVDISDSVINQLSQQYRVSPAAMRFRLINLGFIPPY